MSRRRIAWGMGANLIDRFAGLALQLALLPILVTGWGLAKYGSWAMLTAVPGVLALGDLGFAMAATVRMTMELARGERAAAQATLHSATQVVSLACLAIFAVACAAALWLPDRWFAGQLATSPDEFRAAIGLLAIYAALILISGLVIGLFRSISRFAVGSAISTVTQLLESGLLIAAVLLGYGLATGALALVTGRLIGIATGLIVAARAGAGLMPGIRHGSAQVRRELWRPALAAMAIPLAFAVLLQGQVIALGLVAGAAAVPAFVAARTLSRIGLQGVQTLTFPVMPEFGTAAAQGDRRRMIRLFSLVAGSASIIAVVFAGLLALTGQWLVLRWSGQTIAVSQGLILAIAVSALASCIWNPVSNLILAINRQASFAGALVALTVLGLGLTFALGPALGNAAPAIAAALIDLAMLGIVLRFARREWGAPSEWWAAGREILSEGRGVMGRLFGRPR